MKSPRGIIARLGTSLVISFVFSFSMSSASAQSHLSAAQHLSERERTMLEEETVTARETNPQAFARLDAIRARWDRYHQLKQSRRAPLQRWLRTLGPEGVLPLLEDLMLGPNALSSSQQSHDWLVGVLEALGRYRSARAATVFVAIVETERTSLAVARAAAEGLAKLESDAAVARLLRWAQGTGVARHAALVAMGYCRRLSIAVALKGQLEVGPNPALALAIVTSLGRIGAARVWNAGSSHPGEEAAVRNTAAKALVQQYLNYGAGVRAAIVRSLLMIDSPATAGLIEEQRLQSPTASQSAWDSLEARIARNPLH